jgi:dTMP kinase
MTSQGLFISFEGTDGSGKSTQLRLLAERLKSQGYSVVVSAEPGGTPIGQQIRRILLDAANNDMSAMAELLLMFASRAQTAEQWIRPALQRGEVVLSDRWTDSSLAYQGEARGLGFETVRALHRLTLGSLLPELTICIEIDLEAGLRRAKQRNLLATAETLQKQTRLDEQSLEFYRKVRNGYRKIAAEEPDRFQVVHGDGTPETVAERVWAVIAPKLERLPLTTGGR